MALKEHRVCTHCGRPMAADGERCTHCGLAVQAEADLPFVRDETIEVIVSPPNPGSKRPKPDPRARAKTGALGAAKHRPATPAVGSDVLPPSAESPSQAVAEADEVEPLQAEVRSGSSHAYGLDSQELHRADTRDGLAPGVESKIKAGAARPVFIGGCEVLNEIARGAMGVVYRAHQVKLDRIVALKIMIAGEAASEGQVKRFLQEARSAARLKHPNIVPIFEVGEEDGRHYFTMEFIEGTTLSSMIAKKPLNVAQVLALMEPVAEAVHYAHTQGIIHRDLKPANILIDERGQPRVADFGLARDVSGASSLSQTGNVVGTPAYLSPEQAQGLELDPRSDVYALGVVMYEMLTGKVPFEGNNLPVLLTQIVLDDPQPIEKYLPTIDSDLKTIIATCLEKDRQRRYRTAEALAADLRRFRNGEPIAARPASMAYRMSRQFKRHKGMLSGAAIALVAVLGSIGVWWQLENARSAAEASRQRADLERKKAEADKAVAERQAKALAQTNQQLVQQSKKTWVTVISDSFDHSPLGPAWLAHSGLWTVKDGAAFGDGVSSGLSREAVLMLKTPLRGDLRVSLTASSDSPTSPELALCVETTTSSPGDKGYFISLKPTGLRIACNRVALYSAEDPKLVMGQSTRIQFERDGNALRIQINDQPPILLTDWSPPVGENLAQVAVYGWDSRLTVESMTVEQAGLPEKPGLLDVAAYQRSCGKVAAAVDNLDLLMQQSKLPAERREALLMKASCLEDLEQAEKALATYQQAMTEFPTAETIFRAAAGRIRVGESANDVIAELDRAFPKHDGWEGVVPAIFSSLFKSKGQVGVEEVRERLKQAEHCRDNLVSEAALRRCGSMIAQTDEMLCFNQITSHDDTFQIELLSQAVKYDPGNYLAWYFLAQAQHRTSHWSDAEVSYTKASTLHTPTAGMMVNHALLLRVLGRSADAIKLAQECRVKWPAEPGALVVLAACNLEAHNMDAAMADVEEALRILPGYSEAERIKAMVLDRSGHNAEAIVLARAVADKNRTSVSCWMSLGEILANGNRHEEAVEVWKKVVELQPGNENALVYLALANMDAGRNEAAMAYLNRCTKYPGIPFFRSQCLFSMGRFDQALEQAEQAQANYEKVKGSELSSALITQSLALQAGCLIALHRSPEAVPLLDQADQLKSTIESRAYAAAFRGDLAADAGKSQEALKCYQQADVSMRDVWLPKFVAARLKAQLAKEPALAPHEASQDGLNP